MSTPSSATMHSNEYGNMNISKWLLQLRKSLVDTSRRISRVARGKRSTIPELNSDVLLRIIAHLDTKDLINWRSTCHHARYLGERLFRLRSRAQLDPFADDVFRFENMMRQYELVYVGRRALAALNGDAVCEVIPELQLCVTRRRARKVEAFLVKMEHYHYEGRRVRFTPIDDEDIDADSDFDGPHGIHTIDTGILRTVSLRRANGGPRITIMVTRGPYSLSALPCAWSTLFMNAVSPDHIRCLYPSLTLNRRGLISSQWLKRDADVRYASSLAKELQWEGYEHTGDLASQHVRFSSAVPPLAPHHRPIATRSMRDSHVLHITFATCATASNSGVDFLGKKRDIFWRLGGIDKLEAGGVAFKVPFACVTDFMNNFLM